MFFSPMHQSQRSRAHCADVWDHCSLWIALNVHFIVVLWVVGLRVHYCFFYMPRCTLVYSGCVCYSWAIYSLLNLDMRFAGQYVHLPPRRPSMGAVLVPLDRVVRFACRCADLFSGDSRFGGNPRRSHQHQPVRQPFALCIRHFQLRPHGEKCANELSACS